MDTAELKIDLINRITGLTDIVRVKDLLQLVRFQSDESVYVTNEDEKKAISEARTQISNGEVISNEAFQKEIQEWLVK